MGKGAALRRAIDEILPCAVVKDADLEYEPADYARSREDGKKLTWRDGVHALATLIHLRLSSDVALFGVRRDLEYHRRRQESLATHHPLRQRQAEIARDA